MIFDPRSLQAALEALGAVLEDRGLRYHLVVAGGGSLLLLGLLERPTKDLDVLALVGPDGFSEADPLPSELRIAIEDVAMLLGLAPTWIDVRFSAQLRGGLPPEFELRLERRHLAGLELSIASRYDQICFKLYAAVDGSPDDKHFSDLRALAPTADELASAASWVKTQDAAPEFAEFVDQVIARLDERRRE